MLQLTFLWLGTAALLVTLTTLGGSVILEVRGGVRHMVDVLGGVLGATLWAIWGLGATNIQVVSNGTVVTEGSASLGFVAVIMGGVSLILAIVGVSSLANVLGEGPESGGELYQ